MLSKKAPPFVPRCTPGFAAAAGNTNPVYSIIHSLHTVCNPPGVTALQNPHECLTKQTAPSTMKVQQKAPLQSACRAKKMAGRCLLEKGGVPHWAADMPGGNGNGTRYAPPFWVCTVRSGFRAHSAAHSGFCTAAGRTGGCAAEPFGHRCARDAAGRCCCDRTDRRQRLCTDDRGRAHRCCFAAAGCADRTGPCEAGVCLHRCRKRHDQLYLQLRRAGRHLAYRPGGGEHRSPAGAGREPAAGASREQAGGHCGDLLCV